MVGEVALLPEMLFAIGRSAGVPKDKLRQMIERLPPELRAASCFFDLQTELWRYEYGEPLDGLAEFQHQGFVIEILFKVIWSPFVFCLPIDDPLARPGAPSVSVTAHVPSPGPELAVVQVWRPSSCQRPSSSACPCPGSCCLCP